MTVRGWVAPCGQTDGGAMFKMRIHATFRWGCFTNCISSWNTRYSGFFFTQCRMVIPYRRFGTNYPSSSWSFKKLKNERKRFVTSFLSITVVLTRCDRLYHQATCLAFTIAAVFNGDRTEWGFSSAVLQMMYHSHEMGETRRMNNWRDER